MRSWLLFTALLAVAGADVLFEHFGFVNCTGTPAASREYSLGVCADAVFSSTGTLRFVECNASVARGAKWWFFWGANCTGRSEYIEDTSGACLWSLITTHARIMCLGDGGGGVPSGASRARTPTF
jgi:hypothetical protein